MNPQALAAALLAFIAELDSRFQGLSEDEQRSKVQAWAIMLADRGCDRDELIKAARRAYSGSQRPLNPIGAVLFELSELQRAKATRLFIEAPKREPRDVMAAYRGTGADQFVCPVCGAGMGVACSEDGRLKAAPHLRRLHLTHK